MAREPRIGLAEFLNVLAGEGRLALRPDHAGAADNNALITGLKRGPLRRCAGVESTWVGLGQCSHCLFGLFGYIEL